MNKKRLYNDAIRLLKDLIEIPSFSMEENHTADLISNWLKVKNILPGRVDNNIWAINKYFDPEKPSILLNSHHDTVKPNKAYTNNPFVAKEEDGKLYGLGSNDAGGCLVALLSVFYHFYEQCDMKYNLIMVASAEEENSGENGLRSVLDQLPKLDFAVVGEPTEMQLAVAEKGLLVIDGYAHGIAGHAAHDSIDNAIYNALEDISWIRNYRFPKKSETLGNVKMTVTQINAGKQHNVIPSICHFVVDIRVNDQYDNKVVFEFLNAQTKSELVARSFRNNSSCISVNHSFVQAGLKLGKKTYGSSTLSDQVCLNCPSIKIGPGNSLRSHIANEFIYLHEIEEGIDLYIKIFNEIL